MSDPVKNVEIEDVLSSIRRLVSENGHAPAEKKPVASEVPASENGTEDAASGSGDNRLVLTPALRVADSPAVELVAETETLEENAEHASDKALMREIQADIQPLHDSVPNFLQRQIEIEAPTALDSAGPELDALETHVETPDDVAVTDLDAATDVKAVEPEHLTVDAASDDKHDSLETEDAPDGEPRPWETDGELLSEWHSVRSPAVEDFEPDEPGDSDYAGTAVASLAWEDHSEQTESFVADGAAEDDSTEEPAAFTNIPEDALTEAVIEGIAKSEDPVEDTQYEAVLDEEMLRDLVGEIVRQELQGPLGERITRNVRKLVRREINRAMTSQSLSNDF